MVTGQGLQVIPTSRTVQEEKLNKSDHHDVEMGQCAWTGPLQTPPSLKNKNITKAQIEEASSLVEELWVDSPIKDELDIPTPVEAGPLAADEVTSDEESELPGRKRLDKGTGWWGTGAPLRPTKKGRSGDLVDGAGLLLAGQIGVERPSASRRLRGEEVEEDLA